MNRLLGLRGAVVFGLAVAMTLGPACGGGGGSPTTPTPTIATITLTANGASPTITRIRVGERVQFVNSDGRNHEMYSSPFPDHGDCPPLNEVGVITPGATRPSGVLTVERACGFHDHMNHTDARFFGQVVVGGADPDPSPRY